MNILNVGYGTTNPQTLIHLVQSNVALRLEDPRDNINSIINIDFKRGTGLFGESSNNDWRLSSSNSIFNVIKYSNNLTCNILSINENGNVSFAKNIIIQGNFIKNGNDVIYDVSNYIQAVDSNLNTIDSNVSNYVGVTSNVLKSYIDTNDSNVSNYVGVTSNVLKSYVDTNDTNVCECVCLNGVTAADCTVLEFFDSANCECGCI